MGGRVAGCGGWGEGVCEGLLKLEHGVKILNMNKLSKKSQKCIAGKFRRMCKIVCQKSTCEQTFVDGTLNTYC